MKKHLASLAIGMALGIGGLLVLGAVGEPAAVPMPGPAGWDRLKWVAYPNGVTGIFDPASGKLYLYTANMDNCYAVYQLQTLGMRFNKSRP